LACKYWYKCAKKLQIFVRHNIPLVSYKQSSHNMNTTQSSHVSDFNVADDLSTVDVIKIEKKLKTENDNGWSSKDEVIDYFTSHSRLTDSKPAKYLSVFSDANHSDIYLQQEKMKKEVKLATDDGYGCNSKDELTFHEKRFHCSKCDYDASQNGTLKRHVSTIHNKEKGFHCTECDYVTSYNGSLKIHVVSIHGKEKRFHCTKCDYVAS